MTKRRPTIMDALVDPLDNLPPPRRPLPPPLARVFAPSKTEHEPMAKTQTSAHTADEDKARSTHNVDPEDRPGPDGARDLSWSSWIKIIKRTIKEIGDDRVTSVAGGITFFGLLSLFPAITALVSIYGAISDPTTISQHMDALSGVLPEGAVSIISDQVESIAEAPKNALSIAGAVAILLAIYSSMGGVKALLSGLNVAWYEDESRGFFKLNLVAFLFTIGAIALIISLFVAVAVLPILLDYVSLPASTEALLGYLRWPLIALIMTFSLAVLYRYGPSKNDDGWHWISPGAIVATLGLIVASAGFSWYTANFANYNETYGSLGAVVALMMWLWIAGIVVLVGAELNAEVERQLRRENGVEEEPGS